MGMQTDVLCLEVKSSGMVSAEPARFKGMIVTFASGGTVKLRDGGASGTVRFSYTAPQAAGSTNVFVPGQGVRFYENIYADVSSASATVFYG